MKNSTYVRCPVIRSRKAILVQWKWVAAELIIFKDDYGRFLGPASGRGE
ncbi:hypothetical protein [Alkalihalobacillus trypoxylicola]|nr:hypothetical protein [Alkalihalobacillus trypoxylicola]